MTAGVLASVSVLLIAACWTDMRRMQIPNKLTLLFACGGVLYGLLSQGINGLGWTLGGAMAGFVPLYAMHRIGGIGGGDVKWFSAFGAWTGPILTLQLLVWSILIAGGIAALLMILRLPGLRRLGSRLKWPWGIHPLQGGSRVKFPFMLAVAPGFIILLGKG